MLSIRLTLLRSISTLVSFCSPNGVGQFVQLQRGGQQLGVLDEAQHRDVVDALALQDGLAQPADQQFGGAQFLIAIVAAQVVRLELVRQIGRQ